MSKPESQSNCGPSRCYAQVQYLSAVTSAMDEFIVRLTLLVGMQLPAAQGDLAQLLGEWNEIKGQINDELGESSHGA